MAGMKLTETLNQDVAELEKATGKTISQKARALIAAMAATGDQFEDLGTKDAASGRARRKKEAFIKFGRQELNNTEGKDDLIVDLMYQCYLVGYNAGI